MTLYELIAEFRREHPTTSASRTLDMVVRELGSTRDNLREACARLRGRSLPAGGEKLLQELLDRAFQAGLDDLDLPASPAPTAPEKVDAGSIGILVVMAGTAIVVLALAIAAVVMGINQIVQTG